MGSIFTMIVFWLICLNYITVLHGENVDLVADILRMQKSPPNLVGNLCWTKGENIRLLQKISTVDNVRYKILNVEDIVETPLKYHISFVISSSCSMFDYFMLKVLTNEFYKSPHVWIIFGSIDTFLQKDIYVPIDSKIFLVESLNKTYKITTIYQVTKKHNFTISTVAEWTREKGFLYFNDVMFAKNRSDLQRAELRASYVFTDENSITHLASNRFKHQDKLTKINYLLYEHMCDLYNMTHVVITTKEWGLDTDPVTKQFYKGMMYDLVSGKADIAGTISFTPKERLKQFKFLAATTKEIVIKFIFRAPPLPYSANIFMLSFDRNVWYAFAVVMVLCYVVIRVVIKWEAQESSFSEKFKQNKENIPSFMDIFTMQIAAICQMNFFYDPKSISGKIATFTLLLSSAYIYTAFSARIVLLLQSSDNSLVDVGGIYNAKMDMASENTSYNRFFFNFANIRTNEHWRKLIYENRMLAKGSKSKAFMSAENGMKLISKILRNRNTSEGIPKNIHQRNKMPWQGTKFCQRRNYRVLLRFYDFCNWICD